MFFHIYNAVIKCFKQHGFFFSPKDLFHVFIFFFHYILLFFSKFEPNYGDVERESKKQLKILNHIQNRIPIVNTTKAANRHIMEEQRSR